jgi:hypothetical protein
MISHEIKNESCKEQHCHQKINSLKKISPQVEFEAHKDQENPSRLKKYYRHVL